MLSIIIILGLIAAAAFFIYKKNAESDGSILSEEETDDLKANLREMQEAIDEIHENSIETEPQNAYEHYIKWGETLCNTAIALQDTTMLGRGLDKYKQAMILKPDNNLHTTCALHLISASDFDSKYLDDAQEEVHKALVLEPDDAMAYYSWGKILFIRSTKQQEDEHEFGILLRQAAERYRKSILLDADNSMVYADMASILYHISILDDGNESLFKECVDYYRKATEIEPGNSETLKKWANVLSYYAEKKEDTALFENSYKLYSQAYRIDNEDVMILSDWSDTLCKHAEQTNDAKLFDEAIEKLMIAVDEFKMHGRIDLIDISYSSCAQIYMRKAVMENNLDTEFKKIEENILSNIRKSNPGLYARDMAIMQAMLDNIDSSLMYMEECSKYDGVYQTFWKNNNIFDKIRHTPRFTEYLNRFPQENES